MSFLKKLFGAKTPAERIGEGERLLQEGDPGSARLELEAALAAPGLTAGESEQARALLRRARELLSQARLADARALAEAGELDQAVEALALARSLAEDPATRVTVELLQAEAERQRQELVRRREAAEGERERKARAEEEVEEEEPESEGDETLAPLEVALLALPEAEAERLHALIDAAPALGVALTEAYEGKAAAACAAFRSLGPEAAGEPLVQREWARAELEAGDGAKAAELVERARPALAKDPALAELWLETRILAGDQKAIAQAVRELLGVSPVRDFDRAIRALIEADEAEEARGYIDRVLGRDPSLSNLWSLRALACERLGDADAAREGDERAVEEFELAMAADPLSQRRRGAQPTFPLESARRLGAAIEALVDSHEDPQWAAAIVRLLAASDRERGPHWEGLLRRLLRD